MLKVIIILFFYCFPYKLHHRLDSYTRPANAILPSGFSQATEKHLLPTRDV